MSLSDERDENGILLVPTSEEEEEEEDTSSSSSSDDDSIIVSESEGVTDNTSSSSSSSSSEDESEKDSSSSEEDIIVSSSDESEDDDYVQKVCHICHEIVKRCIKHKCARCGKWQHKTCEVKCENDYFCLDCKPFCQRCPQGLKETIIQCNYCKRNLCVDCHLVDFKSDNESCLENWCFKCLLNHRRWQTREAVFASKSLNTYLNRATDAMRFEFVKEVLNDLHKWVFQFVVEKYWFREPNAQYLREIRRGIGDNTLVEHECILADNRIIDIRFSSSIYYFTRKVYELALSTNHTYYIEKWINDGRLSKQFLLSDIFSRALRISSVDMLELLFKKLESEILEYDEAVFTNWFLDIVKSNNSTRPPKIKWFIGKLSEHNLHDRVRYHVVLYECIEHNIHIFPIIEHVPKPCLAISSVYKHQYFNPDGETEYTGVRLDNHIVVVNVFQKALTLQQLCWISVLRNDHTLSYQLPIWMFLELYHWIATTKNLHPAITRAASVFTDKKTGEIPREHVPLDFFNIKRRRMN